MSVTLTVRCLYIQGKMGERGPVGTRGFTVSDHTVVSIWMFSLISVIHIYCCYRVFPDPLAHLGKKEFQGTRYGSSYLLAD